MRRVVAHANRCAYAEAYAEFDGRRAGLDDGAMRQGARPEDTPADRAALEFARKMTVDSASVTDAEFAALLEAHGEKRVVAMVLLLAYANFQDRLLLCLGSPLESGGPGRPLEVTFAPGVLTTRPGPKPPGQSRPLTKAVGTDLIDDDPDWTAISYEDLQARLESQRRRPTRIRVPSWDEVRRGLPPEEAATLKPSRVLWTLVTLGYQPELAIAWKTCMSTFLSEMKIDLTFEEGIFWVTTRAIECSYCMGHVEMGWELAGLTLPEISTRSRLLAGNDWSSFPPEEQRAYAFTRKLNKSPWTISRTDIARLERDFGPERAASVIWAACRGHYMTRVSNGFQLSLERGNVFRNYFQEPSTQRPNGKP
jgi:alkylhydroperoxidase family enzyme